jgi:NitT/TauT family transport system permease protein
MPDNGLLVRLRPIAFIAVLLVLWQFVASRNSTHLLPGPWEAAGGIADLVRHGLLLKYAVASLFRVTWGFYWLPRFGDSPGT